MNEIEKKDENPGENIPEAAFSPAAASLLLSPSSPAFLDGASHFPPAVADQRDGVVACDDACRADGDGVAPARTIA